MIISKENRINNDIRDSFTILKELLGVGRGTSEARTEMKLLRESIIVDNKCPYCGRQGVDRSTRRSEACVECANRIDRMLVMKSKILRAPAPIKPDKAFDTFVNDYESLKYVPISLGGADNTKQIIEACHKYIAANKELYDYRHEQNRQRIAKNLKDHRMAQLRVEYSRYQDQMSEEEFNEVLECQYVQRYARDII